MDSLGPLDRREVLDRAAGLLRARRVRESLDLYDRAIGQGSDPLSVGGERWMAHMLLGDFAGAWAVSDAVLAHTDPADLDRKDRPFHLRPVWDGRAFDGQAVLVRCYHGLGDIVQFARYLPLVARRASRLWVQAPDCVHGLLSGIEGVAGLFPLSDDVDLPGFTVQAELMELPYAFRTTLATLPPPIPFGFGRGRGAREGRPGRKTVGLAWAAGAWDGGHRSLPRDLVARLMDVPGVDWVCLQRGAPLEDAGALPFRDDGQRTLDLRDTAGIIRALDLVISVDTLVAHLAGTLGTPVWTLLHFEADWRWMLEREGCPWYPAMRLFRQPSAGDWPSLVDRVRLALAKGQQNDGIARPESE